MILNCLIKEVCMSSESSSFRTDVTAKLEMLDRLWFKGSYLAEKGGEILIVKKNPKDQQSPNQEEQTALVKTLAQECLDELENSNNNFGTWERINCTARLANVLESYTA